MSNNTIEQNFEQLEKIIDQMQSEEISLNESFELYKTGLELVKNCNEQIEKVETEIKVIEKGSLNE